MNTRIPLIAAFLLVAQASLPVAVHATSIPVTSTADNGAGTLRQALASVANGDTIDASGVSGTILLTTGELLVTNSLTITGPGPNNLAVDGNFPNTTNRVFRIGSNTVVSISSVTITKGFAPGSGAYTEHPTNSGGGIYNDHATLTVSNCTVSGNLAEENGGGIWNYGEGGSASLKIVNCTLSGNSALNPVGFVNLGRGGCIYNDGIEGIASVEIVSSTVSGNSVNYGDGGGIYNFLATLTVSNCILSGNTTGNHGGAGGGIITGGGSAEIVNSTLSGNSAGIGGAILAEGNITINNSTLSGNSAEDGGAVWVNGGTLEIANSTLSSNTADGSGGAIVNVASIAIHNSTLSGNSALNYYGGGIYGVGGSLEIDNSTISGNSANGTYGWAGGIIDLGGATITINNSIIALNTAPTDPDIANSFTGSFNFIGGDPLLGPLQDNGGPTFTHALLPGSPCINAGDPSFAPPPDFDQRGPGFTRVVDGRIDIGAFEVQPPTDSDGDGILDAIDQCLNTPPGAIVDATGCSIAQLVPCDGPVSGGAWKSHGQYVSAVTHEANKFLAAGLITGAQKGAIVAGAAKSNCGK